MGTFDELLEIRTWRQLGQLDKPVALFNYQKYFAPLYQMLTNAANAGFYDMSYLQNIILEESIDGLLTRLLSEV